MVPLKTAIRELNAGHVELMSRYGDFCTTEGELVTYLKRLERFEALSMDPEELQKVLPGQVPENFEKGQFAAIPWEGQVLSALAMARKLAAAVSPAYSPALIRVEKQSEHPDDWYLWTVVAVKDGGTYTVWTMNLSTGSLCHGHYDIPDWHAAYNIMDDKRGHREPDVEHETPSESPCMYPDAIVGMDAFDNTDTHACPLGGDIENDCDGCAYTGDYHYDYEKRDCVPRSTD